LAARTGLTPRAARISADAMVALGLLERHADLYRNGQTAAVFLARRTPADLRPFLRFWDQLSYPVWAKLADALGKGPSDVKAGDVLKDALPVDSGVFLMANLIHYWSPEQNRGFL
jgi:hypothetical protein